jgi:uncharacterized protein
VELRPLGVRCNIGCEYCYQQPQRDAGNTDRGYDMAAMKDAVLAEGGPFTLFGGEPLMLPVADLEHLWAWGLERFGGNAVQTNGTLIRDVHVALFRRFRVRVGISIDGPGELNDARRDHTAARTRRATARTEAAIARLCAEGMPPSLIVTLHRGNATAERLPTLHRWFRELDRLGVEGVRLHLLEVDDPEVARRYLLTPPENVAALLGLAELETELPHLRFDLFAELRKLLAGRDRDVTCVWRACDPYTTPAVRGVEGTGRRSNCGRTNKEGIDFVKASGAGYQRQLALYQTPQSAGGCQGCRFFLQCKGQCPGTGIDGDWRDRSDQCSTWFAMFEHMEADMLARGERPLSRSRLRERLEHAAMRAWSAGDNPSLAQLVAGAGDLDACAAPAPGPRLDGGRLPFRLPAFCRVLWTGDEAREVWQPRFRRIAEAVPHAVPGLLSVTGRDVVALTLAPWQVFALHTALASHRLVAEVVPGPAGLPVFCAVLAGSPAPVRAARDAWVAGDLAAAGVPGCCARAATTDRERGWVDATWPAATRGETGHAGSITRPSVAETNVLLARLGLRAVGHQPCRSECGDSRDSGAAMLAALVGCGRATEARWLAEVLSWPVEWTARHGIAELRIPVCKLAYDTDATEHTLRVAVTSPHHPAEGASGRTFPYATARRLLPITAVR